jgi:hypothetical protein
LPAPAISRGPYVALLARRRLCPAKSDYFSPQTMFDEMRKELLRNGYLIDMIASNPQAQARAVGRYRPVAQRSPNGLGLL